MHEKQAGYVLLLMLLVLLSGSVVGLGHWGSAGGSAPLRQEPHRSATSVAMQHSRQALLSYAALYPFMYGPRGAGPGHFPCPDTDIPQQSSPVLISTVDGPNPPCASALLATGLLPRHVNLPAHRYAFHGEAQQTFGYMVSNAVINNPVNRFVNDHVLLSNSEHSPYLAWVTSESIESAEAALSRLVLPVSTAALLPALRGSVAAWILQRVSEERNVACLRSWLNEVSDRGPLVLSLERVLSLLADPPLALSATSNGQEKSLQNDERDCIPTTNRHVSSERLLIEAVPAESHWFVRNGWPERVRFELSDACALGAELDCYWVFQPRRWVNRASTHDEALQFYWSLRS